MKKILILGVGSYIGVSFASYIKKKDTDGFSVWRTSLRTDEWRDMDWSCYDCVINVTGKAHADIGAVTEEEKQCAKIQTVSIAPLLGRTIEFIHNKKSVSGLFD